MLTDEQIAEALAKIDDRYHKLIIKYLRKVGQTINKIGQLNQSSINLLIQLRRMGVDVKTIEAELRRVTRLTQRDIKNLYQMAADEEYTDAKFEYVTKGIEPDSVRWNDLVKAIYAQTASAMDNLSNTTAVSLYYRDAIDDAVQAVSMGATDYKSAMRETVKRIGKAGLQVQYESGYHRRLDTAVRQNVLDGVRQIQHEAQRLIGEEIGADGVDITAHPNSAPDHEPVQGRRFDLHNFELMQSGQSFEDVDGNHYRGFERPITEWNCRHIVMYILLGISRRIYTDEQLEQWKKDNAEGCEIDGKKYTKYEATQLMRKIETEIRKQKDIAITAQESGDDVLRRECQSNISKLTAKYGQVASAAGLRERFDKTRVEGFKPTFEDVTKKYTAAPAKKEVAVTDLQSFEVNGQVYTVDGKNVKLDYTKHEKNVAELLANELGADVFMVPRVNFPQGVKTPDYFINEKGYDLKTIGNTTGKNPIVNRVKKAKRQAKNFVVDITDANISDAFLIKQLDKVFWSKETQFVDEIIVVKNNKIIKIAKKT